MTGLMKKDWRQAEELLKCWDRLTRYSGQDNGLRSSEPWRLSNLRKAYQGEASYARQLQSLSSTHHEHQGRCYMDNRKEITRAPAVISGVPVGVILLWCPCAEHCCPSGLWAATA